MKTLAAIVFALAASMAAHAQTDKPAKELTAQQRLMGTCNKEVAGLKGDERKKAAFRLPGRQQEAPAGGHEGLRCPEQGQEGR